MALTFEMCAHPLKDGHSVLEMIQSIGYGFLEYPPGPSSLGMLRMSEGCKQ